MAVRSRAGVAAIFAGVVWALSGAGTAEAAGHRQFIVRVEPPYDAMERAVQGLGGVVTHRYANVNAIVVSVPDARLDELIALAGADRVTKDVLVAPPRPVESGAPGRRVKGAVVEAESAVAVEASALSAQPADYAFNNSQIQASALHAGGNFGQDVVVAVIDSGTANSPVVPSLYLGGQVIGGESFVPEDPVLSATSRRNGEHGTWVGTVIAGNAAFGFSNGSGLVQALKRNAPGAIVGACPEPPAVATCRVPMVGVAPAAKLYALKVFPSTGGGTAESRIVAAMDRALTLKRNFNLGTSTAPVAGDGSEDNPYQYEALNIQVVNMSLGGTTFFAGRDLEDQLTTKMLGEGITLVASAGNAGFAAMTGGSPGSGFGALTVGAASEAAHERLVMDLFYYGAGGGFAFRPSDAMQSADFSSRGPTADGRFDPDLTANGVWVFVQGTCGTSSACAAGTASAPLNFVSGTSFSAPTVAGAAALLRRAVPSADAAQIRNALIAGANPAVLGDGSKRTDQGRGFLDVAAALAKLEGGRVSRRIERSRPSGSVIENVAALGIRPVAFRGNSFFTRVRDLKPGQVAHFFVDADVWTDQLVVKLSNVTPALPPDEQNQLFGDDLLVRIADAPTSTWVSPCVIPPAEGCEAFVSSDKTITIDNPQTGVVRIAIQGDWTNAGNVSADLVIERTRRRLGPPTAVGRVRDSEWIPVQVEIPVGTVQAVFELSWEGNWGRYPTNDLDMILLDPSYPTSDPNFDGATLSSPERVVVDAPAAGLWTAYVQGFSVLGLFRGSHGNADDFALRVTADGKRLRALVVD